MLPAQSVSGSANRPVRLGYVKYLNTLPLVQGLASCADVSMHAAVPSHLIDLLEKDEIDVGLVSLIDAARSAAELTLLPVGMIGCDGPTLTVRLFSSVPLSEVREVHADTDSHTSTALVQVLLHLMHAIRVSIVPFDARERMPVRRAATHAAGPGARSGRAEHENDGNEWPEAMLLIGDKVVTDPPPAERYPHQLDLGEAWKGLTGLPFVYAVWMCKAGGVDEADGASEKAGGGAGDVACGGVSGGVRLAAALLDRQRRHNATRLDWIVSAHAGERAWPDEQARTYVGSLLRYEVTAEARMAAEKFVAMAAGLGLCPRRELVWAR